MDLYFSDHLTIITGETGAGKSILLGALGLILGKRADTSVLFNNSGKCVVEATFDISDYQLEAVFEEEDLDFALLTTIRREITASGNSRAFINDTPTNLATLKRIADRLISLHAQHQTLQLSNSDYQLYMLDSFANLLPQCEQFATDYQQYRRQCRRLEQLRSEQTQLLREADFIDFQLQELEAAHLNDEQEQEQLQQQLKQLTHVESIKKNMLDLADTLAANEMSVLSQLNRLLKNINSIRNLGDDYENIAKSLESILIELKEIAHEADSLEEAVEYNPQKTQQIQERLDMLQRLQSKHGVDSVADLKAVCADLTEKRHAIQHSGSEIQAIEKEITRCYAPLLQQARQLSALRQQQAVLLQAKIQERLAAMAMPDARVQIQVETLPEAELYESGLDVVSLLFAANKGSELIELRKVASGGELSRLMLAIQALLADSSELPTLIFDEIDTGISGEVAKKVSTVLREIAERHQLLCITHLPQIASAGNEHLLVYKEKHSDKTFTRVRRLPAEDRIVEIAQMLSGIPPGSSAIENAKELLGVS
ncbi:MAG: DNA repair protein RecN [Sphingobacteriales bacterium]|nr:DNA repair protein RecN [Sphingobacteriales bacterium]